MSDLEQTAIERLKAASDMSLRLFEKPLVITYSGGRTAMCCCIWQGPAASHLRYCTA